MKFSCFMSFPQFSPLSENTILLCCYCDNVYIIKSLKNTVALIAQKTSNLMSCANSKTKKKQTEHTTFSLNTFFFIELKMNRIILFFSEDIYFINFCKLSFKMLLCFVKFLCVCVRVWCKNITCVHCHFSHLNNIKPYNSIILVLIIILFLSYGCRLNFDN